MVFSIPSFTTVGDDYDKKSAKKHEHLKSFAVPGPKSGRLPDALFTRDFKSIHEGDKYVDPGIKERKEKREKVAKIHSQGFRMASIPKKGCGLGSYFGTFAGQIPHETEYVVPRKGEAPPKVPLEKRNMVTAPTRHEPLSHIGSDYVAEFYDSQRVADKMERELHRQKVKGGAFRAACRLGGTFDEAMGTGVSKCYTMTQPMAPRKVVPPSPAKKAEHPWKPSGPTERLAVKVDYREDPYDGFDPRVGKKKIVKTDEKTWRPGGATNTSWYTKSIAFARL